MDKETKENLEERILELEQQVYRLQSAVQILEDRMGPDSESWRR